MFDGLFCLVCVLLAFLYFERLLDRVKLECDRLAAEYDKVVKENLFLNQRIFMYEHVTGIDIVEYLDSEEVVFDGKNDAASV